jgi:hypothetical protein
MEKFREIGGARGEFISEGSVNGWVMQNEYCFQQQPLPSLMILFFSLP